MTETIVQPLPFPEILKEDIASRTDLRGMNKNDIKVGDQNYKVRFDNIQVRGFNLRNKSLLKNIDELADSIEANGLITPMVVDVIKSGEVFLEEGHRRYAALEILKVKHQKAGTLDSWYERFDFVKCAVNGNDVTELDRLTGIYTSNQFEPLNVVECARLARRMKDYFGLTHEQIAKRLGKGSRQTIDNWIRISEQSPEIQDKLEDGEISMNEVLEGLREENKEKKKFTNQIILPGDTRDEEQSTKGKGVGQTIALQQDRSLDAETQNALEEERLFAANSEEQEKMNKAMGNLDKIQVMVKKLEAEHPALVGDVINLCEWSIRDLTNVRDVLAKLQKN